MVSRSEILARMDQRVSELEANFKHCVDTFSSSQRFGGPSLYFHQKTIERRRGHRTMASLLADDVFFDSLYATLAAWGLHRMGPGNTKLRELSEIRESVRAEAAGLDDLSGLIITDVGAAERGSVVDRVWSILTRLKVSQAAAQIVANSKTLHHLLPELVPPIDRQYTFRFFYGRKMLNVEERTAFLEMFGRLLGVGNTQRETIDKLAGEAWNTSRAKVVDNAVMGYVIERLPPAAGRGRKLPEVVTPQPTGAGPDAAAPGAQDAATVRPGATCRDEILAAARSIVSKSGRNAFSILDVLAEMRRGGTSYPEVTIRTHMASHMCAEAPSRKGGRPPDLRRVERGSYALIDWPR
jgi:hypothetical protein